MTVYFGAPDCQHDTRKPHLAAIIHTDAEHVDAADGESCARLPPYCSILVVKYDISCGGQFSGVWAACVSGGFGAAGRGDGFRRS
jgi:hypothetical protein